MIRSVEQYLARAMGEIEGISATRQTTLQKLAAWIRGQIDPGRTARLTFVCTHNSRRSHFAQAWAAVAAARFGVNGVESYSGGTEVTACNPRTIAALRRTGLSIEQQDTGENPLYLANFADDQSPVRLFSKIYNEPGNPQQGFAALLCCADVDEKCPVVHGASARFALHYRDPKTADHTPQEEQVYDRRCQQIATEMCLLMSLLAPGGQ